MAHRRSSTLTILAALSAMFFAEGAAAGAPHDLKNVNKLLELPATTVTVEARAISSFHDMGPIRKLCERNNIPLKKLAPEQLGQLQTVGDIPKVLKSEMGAALPDSEHLEVMMQDGTGGELNAGTKITWTNKMREGCWDCLTGTRALLGKSAKVVATAFVVTIAAPLGAGLGYGLGGVCALVVLAPAALIVGMFTLHPGVGVCLYCWGVKAAAHAGLVAGGAALSADSGLGVWDALSPEAEQVGPHLIWSRDGQS